MIRNRASESRPRDVLRLVTIGPAPAAPPRGRPMLSSLMATALAVGLAVAMGPEHGNAQATDRNALADEGLQSQAVPVSADLSSAAPRAQDGLEYRLEPGDVLKISIPGRDDITGEYRVNERGQVRIPTLGAFDAADTTPSDVERAVSTTVARSRQRPVLVSVDVVGRRPIYVAGLVMRAGSHPFSPGLSVAQALALAGGVARTTSTTWLPTEATREAARASTALDELKSLMARKARLAAEHADAPSIAAIPELIEIAGARLAQELVRRETEIMRSRAAVKEREERSIRDGMALGAQELQALREELKSINEQRNLRDQHLAELRELAKRGMTTKQRLLDSQVLVSSLDRDAQTAIAAIARAQANIQRAERDLDLLRLQRRLQIESEQQANEEQIARQRIVVDSGQQIVQQLTGLPGWILTSGREPVFEYEILRRVGSARPVLIPADELTLLMPGDVLKVAAAAEKTVAPQAAATP